MMHGWWSESTDGPKGGWSDCSHPTHNCWMYYCSVCSVVYLYLYRSAVLVQSNVIVSVM